MSLSPKAIISLIKVANALDQKQAFNASVAVDKLLSKLIPTDSTQCDLPIVPFREFKYDEHYFVEGTPVLTGYAYGRLKKVIFKEEMAEPKTLYGEEEVDGRDVLYPIKG